MKAVLSALQKDGDKTKKERLLFDTEKSEKICDVKNSFHTTVKEYYISKRGIIFAKNINQERLEMVEQESAMDYIGENYPEKYKEFFGDVKEA